MPRTDSDSADKDIPPTHFATTQWSLVVAAGVDPTTESRIALENLCRIYWYPLYTYIRRKGTSLEDAEDLTQGFFAHLLDNDFLRHADSSRGRFRTFLLTSVNNYIRNDWHKGQSARRGGKNIMISLDVQTAEERYRLEPPDDRTPVMYFEKHWALTVIEQCMTSLQEKMTRSGNSKLFAALKNYLIDEGASSSYEHLANQLNMSETAIRVAVHRLRKRFGDLLCEQIAQTVSSPEQVNEEIRYLISILG